VPEAGGFADGFFAGGLRTRTVRRDWRRVNYGDTSIR
jgi:hypothetical protein